MLFLCRLADAGKCHLCSFGVELCVIFTYFAAFRLKKTVDSCRENFYLGCRLLDEFTCMAVIFVCKRLARCRVACFDVGVANVVWHLAVEWTFHV